jgi:hypothetical protein
VKRIGSLIATGLFLVATGCGAGSNPRQLESITLTSSSVGAAVQFVATGHYNQAPVTVLPLSGLWGVYLTGGQAGPTITQDGLAQCTAGAPGTFSILVWAPADPSVPVSQIGSAKKVVVGQTSLTCI